MVSPTARPSNLALLKLSFVLLRPFQTLTPVRSDVVAVTLLSRGTQARKPLAFGTGRCRATERRGNTERVSEHTPVSAPMLNTPGSPSQLGRRLAWSAQLAARSMETEYSRNLILGLDAGGGTACKRLGIVACSPTTLPGLLSRHADVGS